MLKSVDSSFKHVGSEQVAIVHVKLKYLFLQGLGNVVEYGKVDPFESYTLGDVAGSDLRCSLFGDVIEMANDPIK